jgi:hypothetical protein
MNGVIPPLPLYAFMPYTGTSLLSLSDNLIPLSMGVKRKAGRGEAGHMQLQSFSLSFKNVFLMDSAVSFKQWSEVKCQKFLQGAF